jgi:hypothetical protein
METPSLWSLWAGHRQFYLDPTHMCPVHPELVMFLGEYVGFCERTALWFDEVHHVERAQLSQYCLEPSLREQFQKLEKWLYGPMDFGAWMIK